MDGNLKSAALVELTIGDKKIIGLGTKVDWGFSNASSDIKHGVGGFKSGRVAHDILYHFDISFNVFDTSNYENGNFSLQELAIGGGSQLRISKDSPNLNSSPETIFSGGADLFTGVVSGGEDQSVSPSNPVMQNFTLKAFNRVYIPPTT
tara:strand:- start:5772 stop:6218 length:447 start_codon:yes stop_codon:yes gene_type:complete